MGDSYQNDGIWMINLKNCRCSHIYRVGFWFLDEETWMVSWQLQATTKPNISLRSTARVFITITRYVWTTQFDSWAIASCLQLTSASQTVRRCQNVYKCWALVILIQAADIIAMYQPGPQDAYFTRRTGSPTSQDETSRANDASAANMSWEVASAAALLLLSAVLYTSPK